LVVMAFQLPGGLFIAADGRSVGVGGSAWTGCRVTASGGTRLEAGGVDHLASR